MKKYKFIYHYTNYVKLKNILLSETIRFTSVDKSIDMNEYICNKKSLFKEDFKRFFNSIERRKFKKDDFYNLGENVETIYKNLDLINDINISLYQFCTTYKENSLYHWKEFAEEGYGGIICFDYSSKSSNIFDSSFIWYEQVYNWNGINKFFLSFFNDAKNELWNIKDNVKPYLSYLFYEYCVYSKNYDYHKEKEIKIIYILDEESDVTKSIVEKVTNEKEDYIVIKLNNFYPIHSVTIGKKVDEDQKKELVKVINTKYKNVKVKYQKSMVNKR